MRTFFNVATLGLLVLASVEISYAQCRPPFHRTFIAISDNGSCGDTLWFGHDTFATYGLNSQLCESELPPPPPAGVCDIRFVNIPGREGLDTPAGLGQGFKQDYRAYVFQAVSDTFRIRFQPGGGGFPMTFRWNPAVINAICDGAWLQDEFGGVIFRARMHEVESFVLDNSAILSALLVVGRTIFVGDVETRAGQTPERFNLEQNYPNPFNPETKIRFDLPSREFVTLKVFNSVGQEVETLVSGEFVPGIYSVEFDASDLSSGVYYYRIHAGDFVQTKKLLLLR